MKKRPWYITFDKPGKFTSSYAVVLAASALSAAAKWQKKTKLTDSAITEIRELAANVIVH
jgi:hypothetical protein